jgi:hypothetical protein
MAHRRNIVACRDVHLHAGNRERSHSMYEPMLLIPIAKQRIDQTLNVGDAIANIKACRRSPRGNIVERSNS